jgi:hypothetical protein
MTNARNLLNYIKAKNRVKGKEVAKKIGYENESSFSRALAEEGETNVYQRLKAAYPKEYAEYLKATGERPAPAPQMGKEDRAMLLALLNDYLKLKSELKKRPIDDLIDEFDRDTKLLLRGL